MVWGTERRYITYLTSVTRTSTNAITNTNTGKWKVEHIELREQEKVRPWIGKCKFDIDLFELST